RGQVPGDDRADVRGREVRLRRAVAGPVEFTGGPFDQVVERGSGLRQLVRAGEDLSQEPELGGVDRIVGADQAADEAQDGAFDVALDVPGLRVPVAGVCRFARLAQYEADQVLPDVRHVGRSCP